MGNEVDMNEKKYKYTSIISIVLLLLLVTGCIIQENRLVITRKQLEYYRTELISAENQQQQLTATIDGCYAITENTAELLSRSANSITELRRQIEAVRENYQNMENLLLDSYNRMHNNTNLMEGK
jgi:septal ring factor EnvC (AmiA/AmiB activator)